MVTVTYSTKGPSQTISASERNMQPFHINLSMAVLELVNIGGLKAYQYRIDGKRKTINLLMKLSKLRSKNPAIKIQHIYELHQGVGFPRASNKRTQFSIRNKKS